MKSLVELNSVLEDVLLPSNIEKPGTDCVVICDIKISYEKLNKAFIVLFLLFLSQFYKDNK